jgi:hypothetical protein
MGPNFIGEENVTGFGKRVSSSIADDRHPLVEPMNEDFDFDALGDIIVYTRVACGVSFFRLFILATPDSPEEARPTRAGEQTV